MIHPKNELDRSRGRQIGLDDKGRGSVGSREVRRLLCRIGEARPTSGERVTQEQAVDRARRTLHRLGPMSMRPICDRPEKYLRGRASNPYRPWWNMDVLCPRRRYTRNTARDVQGCDHRRKCERRAIWGFPRQRHRAGLPGTKAREELRDGWSEKQALGREENANQAGPRSLRYTLHRDGGERGRHPGGDDQRDNCVHW